MLPNLKSLTLTQLRAQITPTKRDALIAINAGIDAAADDPIRTYCKDGQIESQSITFRDVETGVVIINKMITWTYYKTGEVNSITIVETDGALNEVSRMIIKHFEDGRQPEVLK